MSIKNDFYNRKDQSHKMTSCEACCDTGLIPYFVDENNIVTFYDDVVFCDCEIGIARFQEIERLKRVREERDFIERRNNYREFSLAGHHWILHKQKFESSLAVIYYLGLRPTNFLNKLDKSLLPYMY